MGYQFADPFDNYTTMSQLWDSVTGGTPILSAANARFAAPAGLTGQGVKLPNNVQARKNLLSNQSTLIFGGAINPQTLPGVGGIIPVFSFLDNATYQVSLCVTNDGKLQFYRGLNVTPLATPTATGLITPGVWNFYEAVVTFSNGAGAVTFYFNGDLASPLISATGLNTRNSANAFANQVEISGFGFSGGILHDDLRVFDSTGTFLNGPIGEQRLITKMPSGPGISTNWTPNGVANNWQGASSIPPDVTKYIASATPGQTDLYAMQSAGLTATPSFVLSRHFLEKDDAASRTVAPMIASGVSTSQGSTITVPSSFKYFDQLWENSPATGAHWAAAAADQAQLGQTEIT